MTLPRPPRWFTAEDILHGRVVLDGYPFRYICLTNQPLNVMTAGFRGRAGTNDNLDRLMSAIEFLETRGWELVNFDQGGMAAFLRRIH